jgi:D-serine deaminase-like pyridoxal phosphate-dependent protein
MQLSPIGLTIDELDTPALLLDLEALAHNIAKMADHFRERNVQWRPHAKAFKCPAIAHMLQKAGAIGVTVAKVSEAEVMAACGITDILIAHLVVGSSKAARLAALQKQADVKVTVDHPEHLAELSQAAQATGVTIGVLVDVDLGMKRTGVPTAKDAVDLCRQAAASPGLRFDGLMGYEGHTLMIADPAEKRAAIHSAISKLLETRDLAEQSGHRCRIISAGGSGSYQYTADLAGITEIQAGGGIFACQYYTRLCQVQGHFPAIRVLASVVSRPARDRAILDIGQKSISQYQTPPVLLDYPNCRVTGLSAEHATIAVDSQISLPIGEKVQVLPGYSDFTFVLHDRVLGFRHGRIEAVWDLLGRGKLQ